MNLFVIYVIQFMPSVLFATHHPCCLNIRLDYSVSIVITKIRLTGNKVQPSKDTLIYVIKKKEIKHD